MLSEYGLLNLASVKQYTKIIQDSAVVYPGKPSPCGNSIQSGPVHTVNTGDIPEQSYIRPLNTRNIFDMLLDDFKTKEQANCMKDWVEADSTQQWRSYIDVLEDILTMATRITSLNLYCLSNTVLRVDGSSALFIAVLLPPSSLNLTTHMAVWSIGGSIISLSPLLSSWQIKNQIEKYYISTLVTSSSVADDLLSIICDDPIAMTSLSCIILNDPWISEKTQSTAELLNISLHLSHDLLNPTITITRKERIPSSKVKKEKKVSRTDKLHPPTVNTPSVTTRRRRLRLVHKQMKIEHSSHIASIDDYDSKKDESTVESMAFPFLAYDPGLLDIAVIMVTCSRTQSILTTRKTHLQLLSQCNLWKQRILPTTEDLIFLAERPLCCIEELLMEMMTLSEKGSIVYVSSPCSRDVLFQEVRPSVVLASDTQCFEMSDWIMNEINDQKLSVQQQIWKEYINRKDMLLATNILFPIVGDRIFSPLLIRTGLDRLRLRSLPTIDPIVHIHKLVNDRCPVTHTYVDQELGSILFSTSYQDNNTFGHGGAPLINVRVFLRSIPSRRLHITDKIQLRGVSSEEEVAEEFDDDCVFIRDRSTHQHSIKQSHVLLCSPCQGRGEIWIQGLDYLPISSDKWISTNLYGLWRDDGAIEILDI